METIPQILRAAEKRSNHTSQPPGNIKKIKELFEVGISQRQRKHTLRVLQVLYRYFRECDITPMEFYRECEKPLYEEAIETAPALIS